MRWAAVKNSVGEILDLAGVAVARGDRDLGALPDDGEDHGRRVVEISFRRFQDALGADDFDVDAPVGVEAAVGRGDETG